MHRLLLVLLAIANVASASDLSPLSLRVEVPSHVVDGSALHARVILEASASVTVPEAQYPRTVTILIRSVRDDRTRQCLVHHAIIPQAWNAAGRSVLLGPGAGAPLDVDLLFEYPLGLPPGEYELTARYLAPATNGASWSGTIESQAAPFVIVAPSGADSSAYREFCALCAALVRADRDAAAPALAYIKSHPHFAYGSGLLLLAAQRSEGAIRQEIDSYITDHLKGSSAAEAASSDIRSMADRDAAVAAAERYREEAARQLQAATSEEVRALQRLGTIIDSSGFAKREEFLSRFPRSYFAPEIVVSMIVAVEEGIMPPGKSVEQRENVLRELKARVMREYPGSVQSKRLAGSAIQ